MTFKDINVPLRTDNDFQANTNFLTEVSKGQVVGHSLVQKIGLLPSLSSGENGTVWSGGGTVAFPEVSGPISFVSTSPLDTAAGTGARTLAFTALTDTYSRAVTPVVTLNGTTPVVVTGPYLRINRMTVASAGSGGLNVGTITGTIGGVVVFHCPPGINSALSTSGSTSLGVTAFILQMKVNAYPLSGPGGPVTVTFWTRPVGNTWQISDLATCRGDGSPALLTYESPIKIVDKSDVYVQAESTANNMKVFVRYDLLAVSA